MKKQTELLTLLLSAFLTITITGCNNKNNQSSETSSSSAGTTSSEQQSDTGDDEYISGYVEGYSDGYHDGQSSGYEDGYNDGKSEGYEDGHDKGYEEGYEDGKEDQDILDHDYRSIHTDAQLEYLNSENYKAVPEGVNGLSELSKPKALEFAIPESPLFDFSEVTSSKLRISEDNKVTNYIEVNGDNCTFQVENLKVNTKYYYYYYAETTHGTFYSDIKEVFIKNEAPRLLNIDGVTNSRDDGGWKI